MEKLFASLPELLTKTLMAVITSFSHNWIALSLAIIVAAILKAHVDTEKLKQALTKRTKVSIFASVAIGAFTPFCACGTMAVVIGMLTTTLPWGPVMAFLTSSPLMSPDGFILIAGVISFKFAVALTIASIVIGLGSGYFTHLIEMKTNFLKNQTRFSAQPQVQTCGCTDTVPEIGGCGGCGTVPATDPTSCCGSASGQTATKDTSTNIFLRFWRKVKWQETFESIINLGLKQIIPNFALFVAIGFLVNYFVPTSLIMGLFSSESVFAIPLAALIGLPLYVTTEASVPFINSLIAAGAGGGAMLAFMITGPATSAWVIAGISTFMKKRVIGLYIFYILAGGILAGYLFDLIQTIGI